MKPRGFLSPTLIAAIAAAVIIGLLSLGISIQTKRLEACKSEYAAFVVGVKIKGDEQEAKTKATIAADKVNKEKADAENATTRAQLDAALQRLRNQRPGGSIVPAAPAGASRPELACYDRAEYQRATGEFVEAVRGLADEGSAGAVDLNTAKRWAQSR